MSSPVQPLWAYPRCVSSVLVVAPTEEPLTLAEGKLRAGLDWPNGDPRDALMRGFIASARQQVERDTGLALLRQTRLVSIDVEAGGLCPIPAQALPVISITEVGGAPVSFLVRPQARALLFPEGVQGSWTVVAGWPTVDALRAEAPLLIHAVGLLTAHYATLGRDLATSAEPFTVPLGYDEAIASFRQVWVV
jgi:uncharacterized phiE125 gp8 family phage protein